MFPNQMNKKMSKVPGGRSRPSESRELASVVSCSALPGSTLPPLLGLLSHPSLRPLFIIGVGVVRHAHMEVTRQLCRDGPLPPPLCESQVINWFTRGVSAFTCWVILLVPVPQFLRKKVFSWARDVVQLVESLCDIHRG